MYNKENYSTDTGKENLMNYTISYLITCCNETETLKNLLDKIVLSMGSNDEVVIVVDSGNYSIETNNIVNNYKKSFPEHIKVIYHDLNKNYGQHKNFGIENCSKDWIFQLDGDELPPDSLTGKNLRILIDFNPTIELYWIPRMNNFIGVTDADAVQWGWNINNPNKLVNWNSGDYQGRLFKRDYPRIHWKNKLHEKIVGYTAYSFLPIDEEYALLHTKTIETQRATNLRYNTEFSVQENQGHSE